MAKTFSISGVPTGVTWTVSSNQTWATVSPASGSGSTNVSVTAASNTGASRTATITVTTVDNFTATVNISQAAGYTLSVSPTSLSFDKSGN